MSDPAAVGIDVGGTKLLGVALDADGTKIDEFREPTPNDSEQLLAAIAGIANRLGGTGTIGLGVPGLVNRDGVLLAAPNVTSVRMLPLRDEIGKRTGRKVIVDNDNTVGALAEWKLGAGRGVDDMLLVGLGTGIGGGVVSGGVLQHGYHGFAAEFGHVVVDPNGPRCPCGRRGCWERYASGSGLAWLARQAAQAGDLDAVLTTAGGLDALRGEHVRDAAEHGDPQAIAVVDTFAQWVALGLMNLTNLYDPELIVIGGGLSTNADLYLPPIEKWFAEMSFVGVDRPAPRLAFAELGAYAGGIGAALLSHGY